MELLGNVKNYHWGKLGSTSEVANLASLNSKDFTVDQKVPYAELWMGAHTSGPSVVKETGVEFNKYLEKQPKEVIGGHESLPFLFKVLSVHQALSIQVHPNKVEAERLHSERPDVYKDPNHKPEMAIALTPFLAMCGFRPYNEILDFCRKLPPMMELLGKNNVEALAQGMQGLKICFKALMVSNDDAVANCIKEISENYTDILKSSDIFEVFTKINTDFPNDVGVLCVFFLNILRLKPGEIIFLSANEIHAYLEGNCIECMACSDNVIRAGLTPKYKDVTTLLEMLNYEGLPANEKLFQNSRKIDEFLELHIPKVKDFAVGKLAIPKTHSEDYKLKNQKFGAILLVLDGEKILKAGNLPEVHLKRGSIAFVPGNCGDDITVTSPLVNSTDKDFIAYIAMYNDFI